LAGVLMFGQMKITTYFKPPQVPGNLGALAWGAKMPDMWSLMWSMNIVFAIMMGWFVYSVAAAVGLYIITTTLFGVIQQTVQFRPAIKAKYYASRGIPTIIEWE
jgi:membrane protein insertase Oxa1/YidC/SpoIIIJ